MELPFGGTVCSDDFESGTRAAAFGGTTTIIDFAIQYHGKTFQQTIDDWHAKAAGKCAIDYGYHLAITEYEAKHKQEFKRIVDQGVTTFKLFLAYPGVFMVDDQTMFRVMQSAGEAGGMTLVHAENGIAITEMIDNLVAAGKIEPKYHAQSRPPVMQADGVARGVQSRGGRQRPRLHRPRLLRSRHDRAAAHRATKATPPSAKRARSIFSSTKPTTTNPISKARNMSSLRRWSARKTSSRSGRD